MKLLMIIVDESRKEEVEVFLDRAGVTGFTEVSRAAGSGETGPRLGSRAFPATSAVVFTILSVEALQKLREGMEDFCRACGPALKMVVWDVEEMW